MHNALAGVAAGLAAGLALDEIVPGLAAPSRAKHRSTVIRAGGVTIVDDAYNAAPESVRAALELLAGLPATRRIAILGEMRELGDAHAAGHREVGEAAAAVLDLLVVVDGAPGGAAAGITEGALAAGMAPDRVVTAADPASAVDVALAVVAPGDVVLVKASRGIELERVVDALAAALGGVAGMTLELIQGMLLAFALVVILMPPYMRLMRHIRIGKRIREEGPQSHMVKWGTPTMGGLLVIIVVIVIFLVLRWPPQGGVIAPLATLAFVGLLGAADDYLNARTGRGSASARSSSGSRWSRWSSRTRSRTPTRSPGSACHSSATSRSTRSSTSSSPRSRSSPRPTASTSPTASTASRAGRSRSRSSSFLIIALLNVPAQPQIALLCALIVGALLGFLWFNVHPAQVFMGDAGSLSLGATLAVIALITGQILVLPIIGLIFVLETLSDIIQIGYFKLSGGKRVFRMAPLHHHFEQGGWDEEKITLRFWIVGILSGLMGVTLFLASINALV